MRSATAVALALALAFGVGALVWFGYRATTEWQRSTAELVDQRANELLALLMAGLNRDMKGAQLSVLVPINQEAISIDPPHELRQAFARAFARFPYPESFFVWRDTGPGQDGLTYFFNRADRPPTWDEGPVSPDPYPVVLARNPAGTEAFIELARAQAASGRSFAIVDTVIRGVPYQSVVHLLYRSDRRRALFGLVGFTVDMNWVRESYFTPIIRQVSRIGGRANEMALEIVAEDGTVVSRNGLLAGGGIARERRFPLLFVDPDLLAALSPRPAVHSWTARVSPGENSALRDVAQGAGRTFWFISLAAIATATALVVTARATRAAAVLATMQSDFVSTVTHELKTPLASMRLISDTLVKRRYASTETIGVYARMLSDESERLRGLIDNLLTFARVTDGAKTSSREDFDLCEVVEDVLEYAQARLDDRSIGVELHVPHSLPRVRIDRVAIMQALGNLVDNVIKYSPAGGKLVITGQHEREGVRLAVADTGTGIPAEDLDRVFERFFRGRGVKTGGSGLGLTIARRIVEDHGGTIQIRSAVGEGTVVTMTLPVHGRA